MLIEPLFWRDFVLVRPGRQGGQGEEQSRYPTLPLTLPRQHLLLTQNGRQQNGAQKPDRSRRSRQTTTPFLLVAMVLLTRLRYLLGRDRRPVSLARKHGREFPYYAS